MVTDQANKKNNIEWKLTLRCRLHKYTEPELSYHCSCRCHISFRIFALFQFQTQQCLEGVFPYSVRKYPPFPLLSHISVVVCLRCLLHHILSLIAYTFRKTGNLFSSLLYSLWWVQIVGYVLPCRSYSFVCTVHHLIIIIVQSYLKTYIFCRVCE